MGNCEKAKDCKPEETPSPPSEQQTSHVYSHLAPMQAYYDPRMTMLPYFSTAVASGHPPPPYMWGPLQHVLPPYAAMYPHGGVYAHPGVTVAANSNPNPIPTPVAIDSPARSSGNSDRGLIKKLKGIDGLTMSIGYNNAISNSRETEGSSEGSDVNTSCKNDRKRARGGSSTSSELGKTESDANGVSKKATGVMILGKEVGAVISGDLASDTLVLQSEQELKREKRKQSNRESARRSRLRKQAEAEELGTRVESLTTENLKLQSQINQLTVNATNLKLQNAKLLEKLKAVQLEEAKGSSLTTANLLSRVDNGSGSVAGDATGSGAPLHQLLDASPRADPVGAS